ncbi:MAG: DUF6286 domain-containing protein [Nocardioides sp.]|nr:DUF6286 domain-containing protein [Nocardioides sp.]
MAWPSRVEEVAEQVHSLVIDQVEPLTGVQIRTADVTVKLVTRSRGHRGGVVKNVERVVPRTRPAAAGLAALVDVLWIALAVVAVRELAVTQGWATGEAWLPDVLERLDGRTADVLTAVVGGVLVVLVVLVVLGQLALYVALKPGRTTHLATTTDADLWLTRGALAALAHAVVDRQPGVVSVHAEPTRRRVTLHVVAREDRAGLEQRVRAALGEQLHPLTRLASSSVKDADENVKDAFNPDPTMTSG